jgi:long-chain acyl-CoA synthetase
VVHAAGSLRALLEARAAAHPGRPALTEAATGRTLAYDALAASTARVAGALAAAGVAAGDRVALLLPNTPEMVIAYLAAIALGAVATPINAHLTGGETLALLRHAGPALVLATPERWRAVVAQQDAGGLRVETVRLGEWPPLASLRAAATYPTPEPAGGAPAMMLYTSGTSGRAKGALLTHRNLLANARDIAAWLRLDATDRLMCVMPLFHANGLVLTLVTPLLAGGETVLCERFSASGHWERVRRFRPTTFGSVATMLSLLLDRDQAPPADAAASLRFVLCGSAPVPAETIRRFETRFGVPVIEGYGLTEATCRATFNPVDGGHRPGSAGLAIGNELRVADAAGHALGAGEIGEIHLRGANVMAGYFRDPAATAAVLRDGWLRTGDLARRDDDGFVWIVDRASDLIIRGGENVYPREIDEVLSAHPAVADAVAVGVPDARYGEEIEAAVTLRTGAAVGVDALLAHCRERLAPFKCPKRIHVLPAIPKGPTGKLLRRRVRSAILAARGP